MNGQILSTYQSQQLHISILVYFLCNGCKNCVTAMLEEVLPDHNITSLEISAYGGLLEKKWASILRLQKKNDLEILSLENELASLKNQLSLNICSIPSTSFQDPEHWLPDYPPSLTLQSHRKPLTCIAFHPVFTILASGSDDSNIKLWDWNDGELENTLKGHTSSVLGLDFSPNHQYSQLASCSTDLTIKIWDCNHNYACVRTLVGHEHVVSSVRFITGQIYNSSSNVVVSASRDNTLRIWDTETGFCLKILRNHCDWIRNICPIDNGKLILAADSDRTIKVWDIQSCQVVTTLISHENVVECVDVAPPETFKYVEYLLNPVSPINCDGQPYIVASGSRDKMVILWDIRGPKLKVLSGHDNWVRDVEFHPFGKYLLSASDDKTIRCWDLAQNCHCVRVISNIHEHFINCIKWFPLRTHSLVRAKAPNDDSTCVPRNMTARSNSLSAIKLVFATGSADLTLKIFKS